MIYKQRGVIVKRIGRCIITALIILLFLVGAFIFAFPYVSEHIHSKSQTRVIESFNESIKAVDDSYLEELIKAAREYNDVLRKNLQRFYLSEDDLKQYHNMLRVNNETIEGVIGSLDIDRIGINLPIYRGTDDVTLRIGVGHIEGTSLPVGGIGTHTVLTGHRGLHTAKLLTDIDRMEVGDIFVISTLNLRMYYEIDRIVIVAPDDFSDIMICPDNDYATLLTCTPIGVNTHRLLVRGIRIPDVQASEIIFAIEKYQLSIIDYIKICLLFISLLLLIILLFILKKRMKSNKNVRCK